jgi:hypothetical protein
VPGILGQPGRVVAIGIAAGQAEDPLPHEVQRRVLDLAGLAVVPQTAGHGLHDAKFAVHCLEQHGAAVGAGRGDVEPGISVRRLAGPRRPATTSWSRTTLRHILTTGRALLTAEPFVPHPPYKFPETEMR